MKKNYKKLILGMFSLGILAFSSSAQDCSNGRYTSEVFTGFTVDSDIQYGSNVDRDGNNENLLADVYTPDGDAETDRPLLIVAHGGSFEFGSKTGTDVVPIAEAFVKRGYVVATINYRKGILQGFTPPSDEDAGNAVMRATQDLKAAIRFFRNSAVNDGNPYGINDAKIMTCGVSAGGFMALHAAYLDQVSEIPSYVNMSATGLSGGIEGDSGTPGISSDFAAVINIAGAIGDTAWIQNGDTPLLSFHGDQDGTVPYNTDEITLLGLYPLMEVSGSSSISLRADNVDLYHCFKPHYGADHVPHVGNADFLDTTVNYMERFMADFVCDNSPFEFECEYQFSSVEETLLSQSVDVYPNPAQGYFNIETYEAKMKQITVIDIQGKAVVERNVSDNNVNIVTTQLETGIYLIKIDTDKGMVTKRLVINN